MPSRSVIQVDGHERAVRVIAVQATVLRHGFKLIRRVPPRLADEAAPGGLRSSIRAIGAVP